MYASGMSSEFSGASLGDLDEFLLSTSSNNNSADLLVGNLMPLEFGCDFVTTFDEKHLDFPGETLPTTECRAVARLEDVWASSARPSSPFMDTFGDDDHWLPPPPSVSSINYHQQKQQINPHKRCSKHPTSHLPIMPESGSDTVPPTGLVATSSLSKSSRHVGRWTKKEHELFLQGLQLYGKSWKKISALVVTRTLVQIRTHAQKYLQKQTKSAQKAVETAKAELQPAIASPSLCSHLTTDAEPEAAIREAFLVPMHFPESDPSSSWLSSRSHDKVEPNACWNKPEQFLHDEQVVRDYRSDYNAGYYPYSLRSEDENSLVSSDTDLFTSSFFKRRRLTKISSPSSSMLNPMDAMMGSSTLQSNCDGLSSEQPWDSKLNPFSSYRDEGDYSNSYTTGWTE